MQFVWHIYLNIGRCIKVFLKCLQNYNSNKYSALMSINRLRVQFKQFHGFKVLSCKDCGRLVLQFDCIDEYISEINQMYFMLYHGIVPSTIQVIDQCFLQNDTGSLFHHMLTKPVKCYHCNNQVGFMVQTVNKNTQFMLDRIIIDLNNVDLRSLNSIYSSNQHSKEMLQLIENFHFHFQNQQNNNQSKTLKKAEEEEEEEQQQQFLTDHVQQSSEKQYQIEAKLRIQLLKEANKKQQYAIVKQIIHSLDFFSQVLAGLEKRTDQIQHVCNYMKKKVEKVIPQIRKK